MAQAVRRGRTRGLFYTYEGSENGGLVVSGQRNANGEVMKSGGMRSTLNRPALTCTREPLS
jgi:hypothetical protein